MRKKSLTYVFPRQRLLKIRSYFRVWNIENFSERIIFLPSPPQKFRQFCLHRPVPLEFCPVYQSKCQETERLAGKSSKDTAEPREKDLAVEIVISRTHWIQKAARSESETEVEMGVKSELEVEPR